MKYTTTTTFIALAGMTHALPHPQKPADAALPSFSFPSPTSGYGNGGSGGGRPPARPSATQGAKPSFPSAPAPGEGNGNAPSGGKPPGLSGGAGQGFDLGALLDQLKDLPGLSKLPQASSTPESGGARPKFDLGSLLGGLTGNDGAKPSGAPGTGGEGLDLGGLLGGLTGNRPAGAPGTGGVGLDLGNLLGGLTVSNLPKPTVAPGSGGAGLDLGSLLGGRTGGLTGEKGGEKGASPGSGFNLGDLFGGDNGFGGGIGGSPTSASAPVASKTEAASTPTGTGSTGGGNTGNCKPQSPGSSSENGITDKNCCADMAVVFARGTGELGNVGTVTGPPMFKALRSKLGDNRVLVQGVDYPASSAGNANLGGDGGKKMAEAVAQVLSQCPTTKVIVSGYSQGAMVVHNAFSNGLSGSKVAGAVLFGDPLKRQAVGDLSTDEVKQFCGTSDQICGGGGDGGATGGHISYSSSAEAAATFAIQAAGLS